MAGDAARIDDVMRHGCREMEGRFNYKPDLVVLLYANVPVRAAGIVSRHYISIVIALRLLQYSYIISVVDCTACNEGMQFALWHSYE